MQQIKSGHLLVAIAVVVLLYFLAQQYKPFAAKKEACCGMNPQGPMY